MTSFLNRVPQQSWLGIHALVKRFKLLPEDMRHRIQATPAAGSLSLSLQLRWLQSNLPLPA